MILNKKIYSVFALVLAALLVLPVSCSKSSGPDGSPVVATLADEQVSSSTASCLLSIRCDGDWSISFDHGALQSAWCSADPAAGKGNTNVILRLTTNSSEEDRSVAVKVSSGSYQAVVNLVQRGYQKPDEGEGGDVIASKWLEIPQGGQSASTIAVTHYITQGSKKVRNYSILYDKNERIAYWVAYPHHPSYLGGVKREDPYDYDPLISSSLQPVYFSGVSGYDRGHQIPSADRTISFEANKQTFFFTNITPQMSRLNQDMWAKLEEKVRTWMHGCDTLYVVTGALLRTTGNNESVNYAYDKSGNRVAVPNYYYKVLLRLNNSQYDAIGFWFEHRSYGNTYPTAAQTKSVDEIERLSGFDFFKNLPESTQSSVESQWNPKAWGL